MPANTIKRNPMKQFHFFLGMIVLITYVYILLYLDELFPGLAQILRSSFFDKGSSAGRAIPALLILLVLPIFAFVCFVFPKFLEKRLSPRTRPLYEPIFTVGVWYIIGYFSIVCSLFLFLLK